MFPVPMCQATRTMYFHTIFVETLAANNHSTFIPFEWLVTVLILYSDMVADLKGKQCLGVFTEPFVAALMSAGHC